MLCRLSTESFVIVRVVSVLVAGMLRLIVLPVYLQAYLDMARARLEEQRSHAGKVTNKHVQRQVREHYEFFIQINGIRDKFVFVMPSVKKSEQIRPHSKQLRLGWIK